MPMYVRHRIGRKSPADAEARQFREELCFRYLNQYVQNGKLNTQVSKGLITECKKIKGFAGAATRFIAASTEEPQDSIGPRQ